jgi:hypothetical protein
MEYRRGRRREVGGDVVPGLRQAALVEDELHLVGHRALLSFAGGSVWSLADSGRPGKR